jgi:hypothetical protein
MNIRFVNRSPNNSPGKKSLCKDTSGELLLLDDDHGQNEDKEQNAQPNGNPEQRLFNPTPRGKNAAGISPGQSTQPNALVLKHDANDQGN